MQNEVFHKWRRCRRQSTGRVSVLILHIFILSCSFQVLLEPYLHMSWILLCLLSPFRSLPLADSICSKDDNLEGTLRNVMSFLEFLPDRPTARPSQAEGLPRLVSPASTSGTEVRWREQWLCSFSHPIWIPPPPFTGCVTLGGDFRSCLFLLSCGLCCLFACPACLAVPSPILWFGFGSSSGTLLTYLWGPSRGCPS